MPIFTNSAARWGTLIFLGLIAIYIYKRRSRNIVVSSIMFFAKSKSTAEGGQKLHKLQTPLLFFIELMIFLFLILAIADPMSLQNGQLVPVSVVLDDSLSMTAGGDNSPQKLAIKYLEENIFSQSLYRITLIKSGVKSRIMGRRDMTPREAENLLRNWTCDSNTSNLMESVSQALEMSDEDGIVIVLTDHLNPKQTSNVVKWISFGKPLDNFGITGINRINNGNNDRCFFEFTNFSNSEREMTAEIIDMTNNTVLEIVSGKIGAKSSRRLVLKVREQDAILKAVIKNDNVTYDNEAVLLPVKREKLRVKLLFNDKFVENIVKKAVLSTELAKISSNNAQVIISDRLIKGDESLLTQLVIPNATETFYLNKYVAADKEHVLTSDLNIENAAWAVNPIFKRNGKTLLAAGELPLLCVNEDSDMWATVYLNCCLKKSNLYQTTFWPIFFYNFMDWSSQHQEGPVYYNYRSGSKIEVCVDNNTSSLFIQNESDKSEPVETIVRNNKAVFTGSKPGMYTIFDKDKNKVYRVSVNLCSYEESDLSEASSNSEMPQIITNDSMSHFESVKWWFVLVAFVLLLIHQWLISKRRSGYAF